MRIEIIGAISEYTKSKGYHIDTLFSRNSKNSIASIRRIVTYLLLKYDYSPDEVASITNRTREYIIIIKRDVQKELDQKNKEYHKIFDELFFFVEDFLSMKNQ